MLRWLLVPVFLCLLLILAIAGCSFSGKQDTGKDEVAASEGGDGEPPIAPPDEPAMVARDRLCQSLAHIVSLSDGGYESLRGSPFDNERWTGRVVPVDGMRCRIEGVRFPAASYVCLEPLVLAENGSKLGYRFEELSGQLDYCLSGPTWYPINWQRGPLHRFAGGERQLMWRDVSALPKPAVTLNIEEDVDRRAYRIRLSVLTLR